jgi:hypothetical protein
MDKEWGQNGDNARAEPFPQSVISNSSEIERKLDFLRVFRFFTKVDLLTRLNGQCNRGSNSHGIDLRCKMWADAISGRAYAKKGASPGAMQNISSHCQNIGQFLQNRPPTKGTTMSRDSPDILDISHDHVRSRRWLSRLT